jgi:hypothetical protein
MDALVPILQTLNVLDREVLLFLLAMAAVGLAGFCVHVISQYGKRDK